MQGMAGLLAFYEMTGIADLGTKSDSITTEILEEVEERIGEVITERSTVGVFRKL